MKQILLAMNERGSFIIEDLDDHHLVIKADEEYRVRKELETEVRTFFSNHWLCTDSNPLAGEKYLQSRHVVFHCHPYPASYVPVK